MVFFFMLEYQEDKVNLSDNTVSKGAWHASLVLCLFVQIRHASKLVSQ